MGTLLLPNDSAMHSHSAHSHPRPLAIEENMPWFWIWFRTWRLSWFGEGGIMCNEEEEDSQEEPHDDNWTVGVGFFKALIVTLSFITLSC